MAEESNSKGVVTTPFFFLLTLNALFTNVRNKKQSQSKKNSMKQNNIYNVVAAQTPQQNAFDLSHQVLGTTTYGQMRPLKPVFCMPGDRLKCEYEILIRTNPLASPAMQRIWATIHSWYVPHRLVWENFERWIDYIKTGGVLPAFPYIHMTQAVYAASNLIYDSMGIGDPGGTNIFDLSAIPFAAYQLIYNTKYKDQNLITTNLWDDEGGLIDGNNSTETGLQQLRIRAWAHDYFTSNLPTAQKGDPVSLPLGNVTIDEARVLMNTAVTGGSTTLTGSAGNPITGKVNTGDPDIGVDNLYAEAQTAPVGATTINDLRTAEALQKWLELIERSGSRYEELLNAAFNVKIRDERINRPEYVGGTMSPVLISEVLQTSETDGTPQGNMAGHGISVSSGGYSTFHAPEFGYIIPILTIMPEANYSPAIPRHFTAIGDPTQFPWPQFAHLGEQATLNQELDPQHATPGGTFGYLPRYQEHKNIPNQVMRSFLTNYTFWSETRDLSGQDPALNQQFVECDPGNNIFAVPGNENFVFNFMHKILAVRSLPKFGVPSLK